MILKDVKVYQFKVHVLKKDIEKEIKLNAYCRVSQLI